MVRVVYEAFSRPSKTAKKAREIWDRITEEDGAEPKSLKLMYEGRFRDWVFERANGEIDDIGAGMLGWSNKPKS